MLALLLLACAIAAPPRTLFTPVERNLAYDIPLQIGEIAKMLVDKKCVLTIAKIDQCAPKNDNFTPSPYVCVEKQNVGDKTFALRFFKPTKQFTLTLHGVEFKNKEADDPDFQITNYIDEFCTGIKTGDAPVDLNKSITDVLAALKTLNVDGITATNTGNVFNFDNALTITNVKVTVVGSLLTCKSHYGENSVTFEINDPDFITAEATRVITESLFQAKKVHEFIHNTHEKQDTQKLSTFTCEDIKRYFTDFFTKLKPTIYAFVAPNASGGSVDIGDITGPLVSTKNYSFALKCDSVNKNSSPELLKVTLHLNGNPTDLTQAFLQTSFNDIRPLVESFARFLHEIFEATYNV